MRGASWCVGTDRADTLQDVVGEGTEASNNVAFARSRSPFIDSVRMLKPWRRIIPNLWKVFSTFYTVRSTFCLREFFVPLVFLGWIIFYWWYKMIHPRNTNSSKKWMRENMQRWVDLPFFWLQQRNRESTISLAVKNHTKNTNCPKKNYRFPSG